MARVTDTKQQKLLTKLRDLGGSAGNTSLARALGWDEAEYWAVRGRLLDEGRLVRGRGRGGSVMLAEEELSPLPTRVEEDPRESALYDPCLRTLQNSWAKDHRLTDCHFEIIAHQGGRRTGGKWTRPDIVGISVRLFKHWPVPIYDVWTFEVKPLARPEVSGVFEAAAHARAATHAYALYQVEPSDIEDETPWERIISEARRFGVGLVLFSNAADFNTWRFAIEPRRREDPEAIDQFVASQLSEGARSKLATWASQR